MRFNRIEIAHFRNLQSVSLDLSAGLNYFYGDNGVGKTAIIEAVHMLCRGRSFRGGSPQSLIQHDSEALLIRGEGENDHGDRVSLALRRDRQSRTQLKVNGSIESRISRAAQLTPLQVMLPDIGDLVFGSPRLRRRWLDWGTFHVEHDYHVTLKNYLDVLKQRNAVLRIGGRRDQLPVWTNRLVELALLVTDQRVAYLKALKPHLDKVLNRLAPELSISLHYQRGWTEGESLEILLGESLHREVKLGATQWGPHRAEILIRERDTAAGSILSRGQGKMVASALQIGQAALLAELECRTTLFLIDDAGAELDVSHNERFFSLLDDLGSQILATTTLVPRDIFLVTPPGDAAMPALEVNAVTEHPIDTNKQPVRLFHVERGEVRGD